MGKRKLITGIVVGAIVGGLVSLFDKETKRYVEQSLAQTSDVLAHSVKNPTETIQKVRQCALTLNDTIDQNLHGTASTLKTIETSLSRLLKK